MNDDIPPKQCTACGNDYPATTEFFYRNKMGKDGMDARCKACIREYKNRPDIRAHLQDYRKAYYSRPEVQAHKRALDKAYRERPEIQEHMQAYRNSPERREQQQAYYTAYYSDSVKRERILAQTNTYYHSPQGQENRHAYLRQSEVKERNNNRVKAYYHRPEVRKRVLDYHKVYEHRPEVQAHRKAYHNRPEVREHLRIKWRTRRARKRAVSGTHTPAQIREQLKRQKYRCYYAACGHAKFQKVKDQYVYHVDHTYPISRVAGTDIPANDMGYLVLACPACNDSKGDKYPWEWPEGGRLL